MYRSTHAAFVAAVVLFLASTAAAAGPQVTIVVGERAEAIERFAAEEMSGQLKKLFDAQVTIAPAATADAANVVYLGTKASCPLAAKLGNAWPKLSAQGHALKSLEVEGKKILLVAGENGRAVLDAAYAVGRSFGVRAFRFGDLYPTQAPAFTLAGFDRIDAAKREHPGWSASHASPFDLAGFTRDEIQSLLAQLTKLNFTEVVWTPGTVVPRIAVDGDTAGRTVFRGAKVFENTETASADFVEQVRLAGAAVGIDVRPTNAGEKLRPASLLPHPDDLTELTCNLHEADTLSVSQLERYLAPVCGEGVAERVEKAFDFCRQATVLLEQNDSPLGLPSKGLLLFATESVEPPPAWWGEVRTHYLNAMNEMYRANTRAREGGRAFTLYFARRFEFGFEYMNAIEALRKAAIAKKAGNQDEQIAELEKALDSITACCNAMAAVARSNSDRGTIAVMNEYGYRPVTKLLEAADAGN